MHRDLKPANIFITHNEEEEVIKIFDFGIAKATLEGAIGTLSHQTRTANLLGTPAYMSPEQFEGNRHCDGRTDIWAMGVIAFECLLGRLPFVGPGIGGLVLDICSRPLPVPSEQGVVPAGFDEWFARACARQRDERFQGARDAADELLRLLEPAGDRAGRPPEPSGAFSVSGDLGDPSAAPAGESVPARAPAASALSATVPSATGATSSVTIDRDRHHSLARPLSLLAFVFGSIFLLVALYRVIQRPSEPEVVVQASQPQRVTAGLVALGDGERWLAVDGREIGPRAQRQARRIDVAARQSRVVSADFSTVPAPK